MTNALPRILHYVADSRRLPIPQTLNWLSESERHELSFWTNANRRHQWLAGRWIAKRTISRATSGTPIREVEVLSRDQDGLGTSPRVSIDGEASRSHLSISHAGHSILVGWLPSGRGIGVDLVTDVPQTEAFLKSWYSQNERHWISSRQHCGAATLWGLKESVFKACGANEKWNPAAVTIESIEGHRIHGQFRGRPLPPLQAWIRPITGGLAMAVWHTEDAQEVALCS